MGRANLEGTVLSKAKLSHANLKRGNLNNANLEMANLTDAALRLADLNRVKLSLKTWYLMGLATARPCWRRRLPVTPTPRQKYLAIGAGAAHTTAVTAPQPV